MLPCVTLSTINTLLFYVILITRTANFLFTILKLQKYKRISRFEKQYNIKYLKILQTDWKPNPIIAEARGNENVSFLYFHPQL